MMLLVKLIGGPGKRYIEKDSPPSGQRRFGSLYYKRSTYYASWKSGNGFLLHRRSQKLPGKGDSTARGGQS